MRILFLFLVLSLSSFSQNTNSTEGIVLKEIMKGHDFVGYLPEAANWSRDGKKILFDWNPEGNPGNSSYFFDVTKSVSNYKKVEDEWHETFDPKQAQYIERYYELEGALVAICDGMTFPKVVYQTNSEISRVQRLKNPNLVAFRQNGNLFLYDKSKSSVIQLTDFTDENPQNEKKDTSIMEKEEFNHFDYLKKQEMKNEWYSENEFTFLDQPKSIFKHGNYVENLQIDPSSNFISFMLSDYPENKETEVMEFINSDGHAHTFPARNKVSNEDPSHKLGLYNRELDTVFYIDFSALTAIRKKPAYLNDTAKYDKDRNIIMHPLVFNDAKNTALCDIRSYDNKDLWIVLIDLTSGKYTEIDHQYDEAWIGGPGIGSWNEESGTLGWLKDNETVYFQSEVSGYSHLYTYSTTTKKRTQLTSGNWEVHNVQLSANGKLFYITVNKTHPGNRDFYHLQISDGKLIPILTKDGFHDVVVSPDEKQLVVRYSASDLPWELYLTENKPNAKWTRLTYSTSDEFKGINWIKPEVITITASDGIPVYARLYKPEASQSNGAAVLFVHGAGYLQNAHNYWSHYFREYMFHNMLVAEGYTVLDVDYRASEGYGRAYRTAIYRHMGGRDLEDFVDAKNYLVNQLNIDSNRVGIYGGSYGGFITLMGLLTKPGTFTCGAALRSVTDWFHYNHEYTSNILNYPNTDPDAYRKSSPIYYANNLQDRLLMLHGMVDDNVQFQDVVRLSQKFIELGKENWELAVFPVEAHSFTESSSWYDEYRRIYEMFTEELIFAR
jgi:dipeptidyl aminopeptidase/acylaminoacyl peptidase